MGKFREDFLQNSQLHAPRTRSNQQISIAYPPIASHLQVKPSKNFTANNLSRPAVF